MWDSDRKIYSLSNINHAIAEFHLKLFAIYKFHWVLILSIFFSKYLVMWNFVAYHLRTENQVKISSLQAVDPS